MLIRILLIGEVCRARMTEDNQKIEAVACTFTSNIQTILDKFGEDGVKLSIGVGAVNSLKASEVCAFNLVDVPMKVIAGNPKNFIDNAIRSFHVYVNSVLSAYWFEKDNSAYLIHSYGLVQGDYTLCTDGISNPGNSAANGAQEFLNIDKSEKFLQNAHRLVLLIQIKKYGDPDFDGLAKLPDFEYAPLSRSDFNVMNRITRSLLFVDIARQHSLLPVKIMFYVMALECLFTTDDIAIAYKVSNRAANYIGGSEDEIKEYQSLVNDAYRIKSKFVQLQELKKIKTITEMAVISTALDNCLRTIQNFNLP